MSTDLWLNHADVEQSFLTISDIRPMKNKHTLDFVSFTCDFKQKVKKALETGKISKGIQYDSMDFFQKTDMIVTYVNTKRLKGTVKDTEFNFEGYLPKMDIWYPFENGRMKIDKRTFFTNYPQDMLLGRNAGPIIPIGKLKDLPKVQTFDDGELYIVD